MAWSCGDYCLGIASPPCCYIVREKCLHYQNNSPRDHFAACHNYSFLLFPSLAFRIRCSPVSKTYRSCFRTFCCSLTADPLRKDSPSSLFVANPARWMSGRYSERPWSMFGHTPSRIVPGSFDLPTSQNFLFLITASLSPKLEATGGHSPRKGWTPYSPFSEQQKCFRQFSTIPKLECINGPIRPR